VVDIIHMDPIVSNAFSHRVHIQSWRGRITAAALARLERDGARLHAKTGAKIAGLSIASAPLELPDQETRDVAAKLVRSIARIQVASATVIEGEGFWASAARAALAGIHLVSRTDMALGVFKTIEEGAEFSARYAGIPRAQVAALIADARELRSRHLAA
jgi:hypothetical protein